MTQAINSATTATAPLGATKARETALKKEFANELSQKIDAWIGAPGTSHRKAMEQRVAPLLGEPDDSGVRRFDLASLGDEKVAELKRLEKAAEDFEAIFIKGLLTQMRRSSFAEKTEGMGEMATDLMDQAVAESVSRGKGSLGIAQTIFIDMAQRLVKSTGPAQAEDK